MLPAVIAFCDTVSTFSLVFGQSADQFYLFTLLLKVSLLVFLKWRTFRDTNQFSLFLFMSVTFIWLSILHNESEFEIIRLTAYFLHMMATYLLIRQHDFRQYIGFCARILTIYSTLYIFYYFFGALSSVSGRLLFFNNSHPNLGGETLMLAVPLAAISLTPRWVFLACITSIPSLILLQSRAALLVALIATAVYVVGSIERRKSGDGWLLVLMLAVFTILTVAVIPDYVSEFLDSIFRFSDRYRGDGTGFVGRSVRWEQAISVFSQNPAIGVGLNYFEERGLDSPHNFVLYALTTFGLFGVLPIAIFGYGYLRILRIDFFNGLVLLSTLVAVIFNDRFLNLNVYPFLLQYILLAYPALQRSSEVVPSGPTSRFEITK